MAVLCLTKVVSISPSSCNCPFLLRKCLTFDRNLMRQFFCKWSYGAFDIFSTQIELTLKKKIKKSQTSNLKTPCLLFIAEIMLSSCPLNTWVFDGAVNVSFTIVLWKWSYSFCLWKIHQGSLDVLTSLQYSVCVSK